MLGHGTPFVEVGGGGHYDKLVGHFMSGTGISRVPATGFAFGVQRLVHLLDHLGLLGEHRRALRTITLGSEPADVLVVPPSSTTGYVDAVALATEERAAGQVADVYVGEPGRWAQYAAARGIPVTRFTAT